MRIGGAGDDHAGHVRVAQGLLPGGNRRAALCGQLRGRRRRGIDDVFQRDARMRRGIARMNRANPTGAKEHEWDFRTPEGSYIIDFRREHSRFFKALHISYPSPADLKRSSAIHRPAGGDIFIHGEPNRPTKPVSYYKTRDWTNGCIALSDEDLQDLWDLTAGQTPVEIVP